MAARFLILVNTPAEKPAWLGKVAGHAFTVARQYDFDEMDLGPFAAIILTMHSDQIHLAANRDKLEAYLDGGGTIVFNGHVAHPFLPELTPFVPVAQKGLESVRIHREADHRLFAGVDSDDLTYQRGVAGFYGRGSNPPPPQALVLNSVGPGRRAVDWLLERPSGGRLLVHAGNDMFSFLARAPGGAGTALQTFFDWFAETAHADHRSR